MATNTFTKSVTTADYKYQVSFKVSTFEHLCIAREFHDLELTLFTYNSRFDTYAECDEGIRYTAEQYLVFLDLFHQLLTSSYRESPRAFLFSYSTGDVTSWPYVRDHAITIRPFIDLLPVTSSMVLRSDLREEPDYYSTDPDDDGDESYSGDETTTMLNINLAEFRKSYSRPAEVTALLAPPQQPKPPAPSTVPTVDAIQAFLRSL